MDSSQRRSKRSGQKSKRFADSEDSSLPNNKRREHTTLSQATLSQATGSLDLTEENSSQEDLTLSQEPTRSQLAANVTFDEAEAISRVVRYILIADRTKQAISRQQILKHALGGNHKNNRKVIEKAKEYLDKVFGYNFVALESNKYILCNKLQNPLLYSDYSKLEMSHMILLFITLSHIFMNGGSCREEGLWEFFRQLGIVTMDDSQHDYFGDVKYLISTEFVKQRYLEVNKIQETDMTRFEYQWGPRADYELSARDVLKFVAKVYGDENMENFKIQYRAMEAKEREMKDDD